MFEPASMTQLMHGLRYRPKEEEGEVGRKAVKPLLQSGKGYQGPVPHWVCEPEDEIEPRHKEVSIHNAQYSLVSFSLLKDLKKGISIILTAEGFICPGGYYDG